MIEMLKLSDRPNDRDAVGLIYRKLRRRGKPSNKAFGKNEPYVAISKKWLLDVMGIHFAKSNEIILTNIRSRIRDIYINPNRKS